MCRKQNSELYSRVEGNENENRWFKDENWKLREKGIESQTRSMREILIIKGIPDVEHYRELENTEEKVKSFIIYSLSSLSVAVWFLLRASSMIGINCFCLSITSMGYCSWTTN
jgi:hypothetical protein